MTTPYRWELVDYSEYRDDDGNEYAIAHNTRTGEWHNFYGPDAIDDARSFIHYGNETSEDRAARMEPFGSDWQEEQGDRSGVNA